MIAADSEKCIYYNQKDKRSLMMEDNTGQNHSHANESSLDVVLKSLSENQAALVDAGFVIASAHVAFAIKAIEDET